MRLIVMDYQYDSLNEKREECLCGLAVALQVSLVVVLFIGVVVAICLLW